MKKTVRRSAAVFLLVGLFCAGMLVFCGQIFISGDDWVKHTSNRHLYTAGTLQNTGTIRDRAGELLAYSEDGQRKYNPDKSTRLSLLHLVGDTEKFIGQSIQGQYTDLLSGYNPLGGVHLMEQWGLAGGVDLTVSAPVCAAAWDSLKGRSGAVCVYNYETGETICSVSAPSFDPQNKPEIDEEDERFDGIYVSRVLSGAYPPGSTFKLVTLAAALEAFPDLAEREFTCEGFLETEAGGRVVCNNVHGHGKLTLEEALSASCNVVFAELAIELGADRLTVQAEKMGFNQSFSADAFTYSGGSVALSDVNDEELGWAGIGQLTDLATPIAMMRIAGGIANGGKAVSPHFILSGKTAAGIPVSWGNATDPQQIMEPETAETIGEMMRAAVVTTYGAQRFGDLKVCAKTGTAQSVEGEEAHAWFVGFVDDPELPLAFAVVLENAGAGLKEAATVAAKTLAAAETALLSE